MSNRILSTFVSFIATAYFLFFGGLFLQASNSNNPREPSDLMMFSFGVIFMFGALFSLYAIARCLIDKES
jgi:purine-cytosine permease-like protein